MKSYDNAEFLLIKKIQHLKEKYKDIPEIAELEEETKEKIKGILQQVLGTSK